MIMTVSELIAKLGDFPRNMEVVFQSDSLHTIRSAEAVELRTPYGYPTYCTLSENG